MMHSLPVVTAGTAWRPDRNGILNATLADGSRGQVWPGSMGTYSRRYPPQAVPNDKWDVCHLRGPAAAVAICTRLAVEARARAEEQP